MIRRALLAACAATLLVVPSASAGSAPSLSLQISPLRYDTTLSAGEKKKGFVDITNPSAASSEVKLSVQAFRQSNDNGGLEFYDDAVITSGLLLDYSEVTLGPHETLHLAFLVDGTKLRTGDNFAAIFATTIPDTTAPGQQAVKVGTLVIVSNGTPTVHTAKVENLSSSLIQFGDGLTASFSVRNTANENENTGFSPKITVTAWPYINDEVTGPLIFAGRTRAVDYSKKGNYLGIVAVKVQVGDSHQTRYSLLITGYWRFVLPLLILLLLLMIPLLSRRHRRHNKIKIENP